MTLVCNSFLLDLSYYKVVFFLFFFLKNQFLSRWLKYFAYFPLTVNNNSFVLKVMPVKHKEFLFSNK